MAQDPPPAELFSFFTSFTPEPLINIATPAAGRTKPTRPPANSNHFVVLSIVEVQGLNSSFIRKEHLNGYGECCSYVIVRYGKDEKRTKLQPDSLHPKFNMSFAFPHNPEVDEAIFLFLSEDPVSGLGDLFGHIVVPLNDPALPVPVNSTFVREFCSIIRPRASGEMTALQGLRSGREVLATWPNVHPELLGGSKNAAAVTIGAAKLGVALLDLHDLTELQKTTSVIRTEMQAERDILDKTHSSVLSLIGSIGKAAPGAAAIAERFQKDRRSPAPYPIYDSPCLSVGIKELL